MKTLNLSVLVTLCSLTVLGQNHFGLKDGLSWRMPLEQVKQLETDSLAEEKDDQLVYCMKDKNRESKIEYNFDDNQLTSTKSTLVLTCDSLITGKVHTLIKNTLEEAYGEPVESPENNIEDFQHGHGEVTEEWALHNPELKVTYTINCTETGAKIEVIHKLVED